VQEKSGGKVFYLKRRHCPAIKKTAWFWMQWILPTACGSHTAETRSCIPWAKDILLGVLGK